MADGNVTIEINANVTNVVKALDDIEKDTSTFSDKIKEGLSNAFDIEKTVEEFGKKVRSTLSDALKYAVQTGMEYNAQMEQYQASFTTMLGNQESALKHIEELKAMAAATPFEMSDLAGASELLLSFGSSVEDVMPELEMLGDISLGNSDKLNGLALVFAQVKSQGKLMAQDLNQMINQGFNPLQIISEQTGKSMAELRDEMADGAVTFDMLKGAMETATSEGGRFYNSMENASTTTHGLVATLKDNVSEKLGEVFGGLSEILRTDILPALIDIVNSIDAEAITNGIKSIINVVQTLLPLVDGLIASFATFGAVKSIQDMAASFTKASLQVSLYTAQLGVTKIVQASLLSELSLSQVAVGVLTGKISLATAATYAFNAAKTLLTSPTGITLVISLIVGACVALAGFIKNNDDAAKQLKKTQAAIDDINESYQRQTETITQTRDAELANVEIAKRYKDDLARLNEEILSGTLTEEEAIAKKRELKVVAGELQEIFPELSLEFDKTTGAIISQNEQIDKLIDKYISLMEVEAYKEEYEARYKAAVSADIEAGEVLEDVKKTLDKKVYLFEAGKTYKMSPDVMALTLGKDMLLEVDNKGWLEKVYNKDIKRYEMILTPGETFSNNEAYATAYVNKQQTEQRVKETGALATEWGIKLMKANEALSDSKPSETATEAPVAKRANEIDLLKYNVNSLKAQSRYGAATEEQIYKAYQDFIYFATHCRSISEDDKEFLQEAREWVYDYENDLADKAEQEEQERADRAREQRESAAQAAKQARERELDDIEYYHDIGILSDKEYRDQLAEYRDRYFDESFEDYRTLTLKIRDLDKSIAKETLDSFTELYESGEMSGEQYIAAMSAGLAEFGEVLGDEIDGYTALIEAANTKLVDDAFAAQKAVLDNSLESSDKSVKDYIEYYDELSLLRDEYYAEGSEEHAKYTQIIDDGLKSTFELAKSEYSAALDDIEAQFNEEFDAIGAKRDEFARKFDLNGDDYFTTTSHTFTGLYKPNEDGTAFVREEQVITRTRLADITGKTERLKRYSELMKRIKARGNIPPQLLNELFSADVETGILQMETLLNMPQSDFDAAMKQYTEYFNAQSEIADEYVADEISDLKERITDELGEMVPERFFELGEDSAAKFGEAFLPALNETLGNIWLNISGAPGIPFAAMTAGSAAATTTSFTNNYYLVPSEGESTQSQIEACRRQSVITEVMTA